MRRPVQSADAARGGWRRSRAAVAVVASLAAALATTSCICEPAEYEPNEPLGKPDVCDASLVIKLVFAGFFSLPPGGEGGTAKRAVHAKAQRVQTDPNTVTFRAPADAVVPNVAEIRVPYDLIPPFRVECVVGLCDPAFQPAPAAVFGLSVVERAGAEREFSADCSRVGGITATASFGTPSPRAFAGAQRVDLAIEHDGTDLIASARDHATGGAWFEVSRAPIAASGPFLPKLTALNFEPGQMVSYYSLRAPTNAPYAPGQATPQHEAVRAMADALNALADGADALVAATPDAAAATARMEAANQFVQQAVTALETPTGPGKTSPAARRAKKARKAALKAAKTVTQAIAKLDTGGTAKSGAAIKRVGSAALGLARAGDQILPDDLRAAIGGLTLKQFLGK